MIPHLRKRAHRIEGTHALSRGNKYIEQLVDMSFEHSSLFADAPTTTDSLLHLLTKTTSLTDWSLWNRVVSSGARDNRSRDGQARSGLLQGISRPHSHLHRLRRTVPDPKARVQRTSARAARSLAPWPTPRTPQVMSPRSSTRSLPRMMTRCSSTIRTTISPTSRKPRTRTLQCSHSVLNPLFRSVLI